MYDNLSASIDSDGRMQTNEQFIYCMQQTAGTPTDQYNQITIKLKKSGSPNVDLKGVVMSGSVVTPGSSASMTIVECSNNIINSGDVTTSYTDYTFTFDSNHSLASGAQFGLGITTNSSSDNSNELLVGLHNGLVTDYQIGRASGSVMSCSGTRTMFYSHPSGYSMCAKLEKVIPEISSVGLPPPPIILERF